MWSLRPASSLSHRLSPNREEAAPTNALGAQSLANTSRKHAQFSKECVVFEGMGHVYGRNPG